MGKKFLFNFLISSVFVTCCCCADAGLATSEEKLIDFLLNVSNPIIRPVTDTNSPVTVELQLFLDNINELNTKEQYLATTGWLVSRWTDPRLVWTPEKYDGIDAIVIPSAKIWLPDVVLENSARSYREQQTSLLSAHISKNGSVTWISDRQFETVCQIDLRYFPYDSHNCTFKFVSVMHGVAALNLKVSHMNTQKKTIIVNENKTLEREWTIHDNSAYESNFTNAPQNILSSEVNFKLVLNRKIGNLICTLYFSFYSVLYSWHHLY